MKDSEILVKVDTQRLPPRALFHREPVPGSPEDLMARYRGRLPLSVLTDLRHSQHNYSSDGLGGEGTPPSSTADYTPSHSSSGQGITDGEGTPSGDDSSNHATPTSSSPDSYWDENVQPFPVNSGSMHQVVQKSDSTALMTRPREMWVPNIIVDDNSYSVSATTVEKPKSGGQDNRSSLEEQSAIDANLLRRPAFQWSRISPPYQIFNGARSAFLHYLVRNAEQTLGW